MHLIKFKAKRCARCRDELSAEEKLGGKGNICDFCDHMYAEALDIYQRQSTVSALSITTQSNA